MIYIKEIINKLDANEWNKKYFNINVTPVVDVELAYKTVFGMRFCDKEHLKLNTEESTKFIEALCKNFTQSERGWLKYGYYFKFNSDTNEIIILNKAYGCLIFKLEDI